MMRSEAIFRESILCDSARLPFTKEVALSMTMTTFIDIIPDLSGCTKFVAYEHSNELVTDDEFGEELRPYFRNVLQKRIGCLSELGDGVIAVGYIDPEDKVVVADLYQGYFYRHGSGWFSPTFVPAYVNWVLRASTLERRCVYRYGVAKLLPAGICEHWGGCFDNEIAVVRTISKGILCVGDRGMYEITKEDDDTSITNVPMEE